MRPKRRPWAMVRPAMYLKLNPVELSSLAIDLNSLCRANLCFISCTHTQPNHPVLFTINIIIYYILATGHEHKAAGETLESEA